MERYLKSRLLHIRAMIRAMARTLTLKPDHVMLFYDYIQKVIRTTEKYCRQSGLEELQAAIEKHLPLG